MGIFSEREDYHNPSTYRRWTSPIASFHPRPESPLIHLCILLWTSESRAMVVPLDKNRDPLPPYEIDRRQLVSI